MSRFKKLKVICFLFFAGLFAANFHSLRVTGSSVPKNDVSGAELFANNCARCHGEDVQGGHAATELVGRVVRHRQRGADLIYEAYEVDIGGSG